MIQITVAICTYNRQPMAAELVELLAEQTVPAARFDVLVVDNSDDAQARDALSAGLAGRAGVRLIHTAPPGLSRARNAALAACAAPFIAFLDDDSRPEPGWLAAILAGFAADGAAVVAGPIRPGWPFPRPNWLPHRFQGCLTILDLGPDDGWFPPGHIAFGANIAFAAARLREVGGFSETVGRSGSHALLSDEETGPQMALQQAGWRVRYAAGAVVTHLIRPERLTRSWFRARMAWQAVSAELGGPAAGRSAAARSELAGAAAALGIGDALARAFAARDEAGFTAQIALIQSLLTVLLDGKDAADPEIEAFFATLAGSPPAFPPPLPPASPPPSPRRGLWHRLRGKGPATDRRPAEDAS